MTAIAAAIAVPCAALAQAGGPSIAIINVTSAGKLVAIIDAGDNDTASCSFTYSHDGSAPTGLPGTIDQDGDCDGAIPGGLSPGNWTITATAVDTAHATGSGTTTFTVGTAGTPSPPPSTPGGGPPDTPAPGSSPSDSPAAGLQALATSGSVDANRTLLECSGTSLAITDVSVRSGRVRILGLTTPGNAGRSIQVAFRHAGNVVATASVAADGSFRAIAPLPPRAVRNTDAARYSASLGSTRTPWLKLSRRIVVSALHPDGSDLVISGHLTRPWPRGTSVTVRAQTSCNKPAGVIARIKPDADGSFSATIPLAATVTGFTVRLSALVSTSHGGTTATYSITRPVQVRRAPVNG